METQRIEYSRSTMTEIIIGNGILKEFSARLSRLTSARRCAVITNETVAKWYLEPLKEELANKGFSAVEIIIPDGEKYKNFETVISLLSELSKNQIDRDCVILGLGGGVICDITGFAASIYKRGITLALVPTSLLAMVDASFGGKNGVNTSEGKNLAGTFYQPALTCVDVSFLLSLPLSQLSYGVVECIKHGLIGDSAYYKFLCNNISEIRARQLVILQRVVRRSVYIKKSFISKDELDKGVRAHLNFGHTFGHALESAGGYIRLNHCEAVGLGMLMAIKTSALLGILKEDYSEQLKIVLRELELPISLPTEISVNSILAYIAQDKKRNEKGLAFVLPVSPGKTLIQHIKSDDLEKIVTIATQI